jgi:hypothetical protein
MVPLNHALQREIAEIAQNLIDRGFYNSSIQVTNTKSAGERNLVERAELISSTIKEVCTSHNVTYAPTLADDLQSLFGDIYQTQQAAVQRNVEKAVPPQNQEICPIDQVQPDVRRYMLELGLFAESLAHQKSGELLSQRTCRMDAHPDVFISYASEDRDAAKRLSADLQNRSVSTWLDVDRLLPGQTWQNEISAAIASSRAFVAVLSNHSINKTGYVQKELREALDVLDMVPENVPFLIPARLDAVKPTHRRLNDLHWVDLFNEWDVGMQKIVATIEHLRAHYATTTTTTTTPPPVIAHSIRGFIQVQANSKAKLADLLAQWSRLPGVTDTTMTFGDVDAMITVQCGSVDEISRIVEQISAGTGVACTKTLVSTPGA